ncbi:hypothetical protein KEU06_08930 [Pseudaminobacter sp. 19-2017]|uniref:Uncharacterized protein n=1 Tax=Pseudaminobacter soli (ex Zhang et al. 2022) TaxID=2831468 RepID=A0A942DWW6_9HYPH|nr:hypothetical protein [Pseudaminobacter soli]MBS3648751.1 hypothetical protein [Pseudaminobacter soli]
MESVVVEFPTGRREVAAYLDTSRRRALQLPVVTPAPIPGYRFEQSIAGDWYAFETWRD